MGERLPFKEVPDNPEQEATKRLPLNEVLALLTGKALSKGSSVTFGQDLGPFLFKDIPDLGHATLSDDDRLKISRLAILSQHPELGEVNAEGVNRDNANQWFAKQVAQFGLELEFRPIDWRFLLEELAKRR